MIRLIATVKRPRRNRIRDFSELRVNLPNAALNFPQRDFRGVR